MADPLDPRSGEVFQRYVALLQNLNGLGIMGFAKLLDTTPPEEMTRLHDVVLYLQNVLDTRKGT